MLAGAGVLSAVFGSTVERSYGMLLRPKEYHQKLNDTINIIELSSVGQSLHLCRTAGAAPQNGSGLKEAAGTELKYFHRRFSATPSGLYHASCACTQYCFENSSVDIQHETLHTLQSMLSDRVD